MSVSGCNSSFQSFQVKQLKVFQGETPVKRYKYLAMNLMGGYFALFHFIYETPETLLKHLSNERK